MVSTRKAFAAAVAALLLASSLSATDYAGDFEMLGTSARAIGMGGAVVASASGPTAIYYNPALASRSERTRIFALHSEDFGGLLQHNFVGVAIPSGLQSFGIAILHNGIPGIKLTKLPNPELPPSDSNRPIVDKVVSANQFVAYLNYSRMLSPFISLGGNAKVIYQNLYVGSCFGMGVDLGLAVSPGAGIDIGLRGRNLSTSPLFWTTGTTEYIEPQLAVGVSKKFEFGESAFSAAIEAETDVDDLRPVANLGVEYSFRNSLFARLGSHQSNFTFGLGARYGRFFIDYGYASGYAQGSQELGSSQQVSGGVEF
ncbi:MAG: hypothetical protein JSU73_04050 [candidate division WOR-3 bacterium]|nr:MAG: hypothetical protein JSU73_04050 [candidate division WOR-3 bacterium]